MRHFLPESGTLWGNRVMGFVVAVLAGCVLAGCASCAGQPEQPVEVIEDTPPPEVEPAPVEEKPRVDDEGVPYDEDSGRPLSRVVHFDFDLAVLRPADIRVLEQHAAFLSTARDRSIAVEGHCDERGTRDYNLALGERRANAVVEFLTTSGVHQSQIADVVSYGEEQPVDVGSNEEAWAKNRRAVIVYQ
ncbi:MAG: peptidoglycan-associated lipoprotein Pal [Gammaproteobacteria bacterium]|nr:peptidoglycan-associated lipoprotein Pal [Gammaproteobacteria bacterium]